MALHGHTKKQRKAIRSKKKVKNAKKQNKKK